MLDHVLLFSPPGSDKTTLTHIITHEVGVSLRQASGSVLERPDDLAALLTNLEANDVLSIDKIHRPSSAMEEILYPALGGYQIDIMISKDPAVCSVKLDLQPLALVGAIARTSMLTNPLHDRFRIVVRLEFYASVELIKIITRSSGLSNAHVVDEGALEIAKHSRGTPRIASRLPRRVHDFTEVKADGIIVCEVTGVALAMLDVDMVDFGPMNHKLPEAILRKSNGGPVDIDNLATTIGERHDTIGDVLEPYLIQQGYLQCTPCGRVAVTSVYQHFELGAPKSGPMRDLWDDNQ